MEFNLYTLPNGIRCIHKRVKSEVAHCAVTVNTGSRDELPGEFGMAHLTEHTLFKGTAKRRAYHINCRLENLGGELNAFTTKEDTTVHATTLRGDCNKAAELIADIVFRSTFPAAEVEKEKKVIIDEINSFRDAPADMIYDHYEDLLFEGSQLGHNILGTRCSVNKLHSEHIRSFVARTYNTDQMVFSLIGNISEKSFQATADRYFGDLPANPRRFVRSAPEAVAPFLKTINKHNHQAHCIIGNRAYGINDRRRLPLLLLVNLLGGPSANSLLNTLVREKNGLSYNIEAGYTPFGETGTATVYFSTDRDKTDLCLELVTRCLTQLKTRLLTPRRLSMAKKQFMGQLAISSESNEGYMLGAAKSYLVYDEVDSMESVYKKVSEISAQSILEAANEIFTDTSTLIYR